MGGTRERVYTKEHKDICGDAHIHYLNAGNSFMGVYMCQLTKLYTLSMCNFSKAVEKT